ncbi:hypothetical protein PR048_016790 [Dryococelus australis]|uniref:PiggyBac transposable element-derived protein domain-containing protein n=1 Tax=Dryococelus australis TaxID=614101 RepID=A0ABQ9H7N9_9NEOP|nr:hypothetical protein PR048_016790 [Dryococelus australis]
MMLLCAIFKSRRESLFCTDTFGRLIFRGVMSLMRCQVLLLALRFDDSFSRKEREKEDPAAAISFIFNKLVSNSQELYTIGAHACIDEALIPLRQVPFSYLMSLTDTHNSYLLNSYIYMGKNSDGMTLSDEERKFTQPTQSVLCLVAPISGSNHNITVDNEFSSVERRKLPYTGTLKTNKREVLKQFLPDKTREVGSSMYGFTDDMTLLSHVPKKSKSCAVDTTNNKPEIISFYNSTKSGVDTMDLKCANYSPNRRTRRWPLAIFYHMISIICVNTDIIHTAVHGTSTLARFDFVKLLANSLIMKHMTRRLQIPNLPSEIRKIITDTFLGYGQDGGRKTEQTDRLDKRKTS